MKSYEYGQYGGLPDPYRVPEGAGPVDFYESMLNGQAAVQALDAAEHPQYQYVLAPETGQPVRFRDGTPTVERIPMEQHMAPIVRRQMVRRLRMRLLMLLPPLLFVAYVAVVVFFPAPVGEWLQGELLPVLAAVMVWGGVAAVGSWAVAQIVRAIT
ncbi:hypothetical protein [Nonomuraea typhae]|uniref:DUF485 domain-containing protein n=1 Tax=Nonomuraea typhae TaxID=2603600 RepID=A0ABW7YJK3_9ACTN